MTPKFFVINFCNYSSLNGQFQPETEIKNPVNPVDPACPTCPMESFYPIPSGWNLFIPFHRGQTKMQFDSILLSRSQSFQRINPVQTGDWLGNLFSLGHKQVLKPLVIVGHTTFPIDGFGGLTFINYLDIFVMSYCYRTF